MSSNQGRPEHGSGDAPRRPRGAFEAIVFDWYGTAVQRDEGVKLMIRMAVKGCARNKTHSGLCG